MRASTWPVRASTRTTSPRRRHGDPERVSAGGDARRSAPDQGLVTVPAPRLRVEPGHPRRLWLITQRSPASTAASRGRRPTCADRLPDARAVRARLTSEPAWPSARRRSGGAARRSGASSSAIPARGDDGDGGSQVRQHGAGACRSRRGVRRRGADTVVRHRVRAGAPAGGGGARGAAEVAGRRLPLRRVLRERALHDGVEGGRQLRPQLRRPWRFVVEVGPHLGLLPLTLERDVPGQHEVEDAAERVHVRPGVDPAGRGSARARRSRACPPTGPTWSGRWSRAPPSRARSHSGTRARTRRSSRSAA